MYKYLNIFITRTFYTDTYYFILKVYELRLVKMGYLICCKILEYFNI